MREVNGIKVYSPNEIPTWPSDVGPPHGESKYGFKIVGEHGKRHWVHATKEEKIAIISQLTGKPRDEVKSDDDCFNSAPSCGGFCGDGGMCVQVQMGNTYVCNCMQ